jgi:hypothetical protein
MPTKLNLRFDEDDQDLHSRISAAAKASCRSKNGEILFRLRQTFKVDDWQQAQSSATNKASA